MYNADVPRLVEEYFKSHPHSKAEEYDNDTDIITFIEAKKMSKETSADFWCAVLDRVDRMEEFNIFDREIVRPKRFGSDFHGELAFHGTFIADQTGNPEPILIFSDRTILRSALFQERNLKFTDMPPLTQHFHEYGWQRTAIKDWLSGRDHLSVQEIYARVRAYVAKYVYHPDDTFYDVVACYILASHVWIAFDAFPRIIVAAKPDSGKSQLVRAIRNLCFKPTSTGDATKAAMFRLASATAGVFIFDNFDMLPEEQKAGIMHFFEISYQADLPVFRTEDGSRKGKIPTGFNAGVPVVAATVDMSAFSLAALTRSIVLVMERVPAGVSYPELPDTEATPESNALRQELYAWGIEQASFAKIAAKEMKIDFAARQSQIAKPILYIASLVGATTAEQVKKMLVENFETHQSENQYDEKSQIVSALYELLGGKKEPVFEVHVKDVAMKLLTLQGISATGEHGYGNPRYPSLLNAKCQIVSCQLKTIPSAASHMKKGVRVYSFQKDALWRYFARLGILPEEELQTKIQTELTPSPSSPPLPSIPSSPSTGGDGG